MKIAVIQFNPTVGDLAENRDQIIQRVKEAYDSGARIVITPELAICGYIPEDLLLRAEFMQDCQYAVNYIAEKLNNLTELYLILGHPTGFSEHHNAVSIQHRFNAASVINSGKIIQTYHKQLLPNYQVFDEYRYFRPGQESVIVEIQGVHYGLLICEDIWFDQPAIQSIKAGAEVLLVLNASPYHLGKQQEREQRVAALASKMAVPIVYAHLAGGQDELIFDGGSFAFNANGSLVARAKQFETDLLLLDLNDRRQLNGHITPLYQEEESLWRALVLGVQDFWRKNNFSGIILGLSGGIDSALVMAIAVDAIGADKVHAVMMPSLYTADISSSDASDMSNRLKVRYDVIPIAETFDIFRQALAPVFAEIKPLDPIQDTTEENIQARIRGTLLMAIANRNGALVLTTGNKSELATGYCTLYGDMAGRFAVIKDLVKTRVYQLARWRNQHDPFQRGANPIPERIITRPPSAELRPDQIDQDNLPPYEILDAIIERFIEKDQSIDQIIAAGFAETEVKKVTQMIKNSEYKRQQSPLGIRLTPRGFGRDWRYPVTSKYRN